MLVEVLKSPPGRKLLSVPILPDILQNAKEKKEKMMIINAAVLVEVLKSPPGRKLLGVPILPDTPQLQREKYILSTLSLRVSNDFFLKNAMIEHFRNFEMFNLGCRLDTN